MKWVWNLLSDYKLFLLKHQLENKYFEEMDKNQRRLSKAFHRAGYLVLKSNAQLEERNTVHELKMVYTRIMITAVKLGWVEPEISHEKIKSEVHLILKGMGLETRHA